MTTLLENYVPRLVAILACSLALVLGTFAMGCGTTDANDEPEEEEEDEIPEPPNRPGNSASNASPIDGTAWMVAENA